MGDRKRSKENYEKIIFEKFILVCPYKIKRETLKNLKPPKPDICLETQNNQKLYFELTECVCECIAKQTGDSLKSLRENIEPASGRSAVPFKEDALFQKSKEKFHKKYKADAPIELLSYFNQQAPPLGNILSDYSCFVEKSIKESPFRRVWVYDVYGNKILYHFPR